MSFVNLLPEDYVARRAQKRVNLLCLVLFGLVMAGVIGGTIASEQGLDKSREVYDRVNQSYSDASKLIGQVQQLETAKQRMFKKAKLAAGLLERVPRSYLLATVTNALPAGGSLKEFSFSSKRRRTVVVSKDAQSRFAKTAAQRDPGAGADPSSRLDLSIEVTGLAGTDVEVARFIASMARCPLIQAVELVYSQEKKFQEAVVREFKVNMRLDPNADVLSAEKQRSGALARADGTGPVGEGK